MSSSKAATEFSEATKKRIRRDVGEEVSCLACGLIEGIDFCHIIGQKDGDFQRLFNIGLVNFPKKNHEDNGITLCARCHRGFDRRFPTLYLVPISLPFFIAFEKNDFLRRLRAFKEQGEKLRREVPTSALYLKHLIDTGESTPSTGPLFRVILRERIHDSRYHKVGTGEQPLPISWHGSPTTLIRHAFQVLREPSPKYLLPHVAAELTELSQLYFGLDPWERALDAGTASGDGAGGNDGAGGKGGGGGGTGGGGGGTGGGGGIGGSGESDGGSGGQNEGGQESRPAGSRPGGDGDTRTAADREMDRGGEGTPSLSDNTTASTASAKSPKGRWIYGPASTSGAKIKTYRDALNANRE